MNFSKIRTALKWIEKKKSYNSVRDITLILFLLSFGTERRKLCNLMWEYISDDFHILNTGQIAKVIPTHLNKWLRILKNEQLKNTTTQNAVYVFGNKGTNLSKPIEESRINEILTGLSKVNPTDDFYKLLTPQNIRKWLFHRLLETHSLQDVMVFMEISISNLNSYLTQNELSKYITSNFFETYPLDDLTKELQF